MDTTPGAVLEGQARVEQQAPQDPSKDTVGKNAALAAGGGLDTERDPSESTPLLLRGQDSSFGQSFPDHLSADDDSESAAPPNPNPNEWPGQKDFEGLSWWRRPTLIKLLIPFSVFMLAFGGIIVPKVDLINDLICRDYYNRKMLSSPNMSPAYNVLGRLNEDCDASDVVGASSTFLAWCNFSAGLISALVSPKLGALSDRYGRIKILILSSAGLLVNEIATICAAKFPETFSTNWILFGYAVDGLGGSFITGMAVSTAYATDVTPPSRRNVAVGYFQGCLFAGVALGPLLAAALIKAFNADLLTLFYVALGCHIFFMASVGLLVPESLSKERQLVARKRYAALHSQDTTTFWKKVAELFTHMFEPLKVLVPSGPGTSAALRRNLCMLAAIDTVMFGVAMGSLTVVILYMKNVFHWPAEDTSLFISLVATSRVLCLFLVLPIVVRLVRGPAPPKVNGVQAAPLPQNGADRLDLTLIRVGVFLDTLGYLGYSLAGVAPLFIASGAVAATGSIASPTLVSAMTKHIPHDQVGQLLGASGLLHALARVAAPLVFNGIFTLTVGTFPPAVFVGLASTFGMAFLLSLFLRPGLYVKESASEGAEERTATAGAQ